MSFVVADIVGPAVEVVGSESASEASPFPSRSTTDWPCHVNVVKITR
jgi:hypothetical protein